MENDDSTLGVTPFLTKTFEMVDDPATNNAVSWRGDDSFVVKDPGLFSTKILPCYFKHNNLSSFVRQLNIYGFRKVASDCWEFAHPKFRKGRLGLLKEISRRKAPKEPEVSALHYAMGMGILKQDAPPYLNASMAVLGMQELMQDKEALIHEVINLRGQHDASQRMLAATLNELYQTRCEQQRSGDTVKRLLAYVASIMPTDRKMEGVGAPGPSENQEGKQQPIPCSIEEIRGWSSVPAQAVAEESRKRPREEKAAIASDAPPLKHRCQAEDLANMASRVDQYAGMCMRTSPSPASFKKGPWSMMPETSPGLMALSQATQLQETGVS